MTLGKTSKAVIKWGIYAVLLLILYCIQTAPSLLTIHHTKPVLLIPLAVCIALFEGEIGSAVFGLITGFLWDFASGKVFGFYGMVLLVCCLLTALLSMYLVRVNVANALLTVGGVSLICSIWNFLFYYLIWGFHGVWLSFGQLLLSSLYTTFFAVPLYYLVRFIATKFNSMIRT